MTDVAKLEHWAQAVVDAAPDLDDEEKLIWIQTFRLLSRGEPVSEAQIADAAGVPTETVVGKLRTWPLVLRDDEDRVIGFWGMHVQHVEPTHAMTMDGSTVYGWCAEDTLLIPEILGRDVHVESTDPRDGTEIKLTVTPEEVTDLHPSDAVVSFLLPEDGFADDAIARFCHRIHFFGSPQTAEDWIADRPGLFYVSVDDAFELGKLINSLRFGDIDQVQPPAS